MRRRLDHTLILVELLAQAFLILRQRLPGLRRKAGRQDNRVTLRRSAAGAWDVLRQLVKETPLFILLFQIGRHSVTS